VVSAGVDARGQAVRADNAGDIRGGEFLPNVERRKSTERSAGAAMPGDNVWSAVGGITRCFSLGAPRASVVGRGRGNSRNGALTQDSAMLVGVSAKTPAAPHSAGSHKPDNRGPGVTHRVGLGVDRTKCVHIGKPGRRRDGYRRSGGHAHCAENDGRRCDGAGGSHPKSLRRRRTPTRHSFRWDARPASRG
jgi:hypothetical protein